MFRVNVLLWSRRQRAQIVEALAQHQAGLGQDAGPVLFSIVALQPVALAGDGHGQRHRLRRVAASR